MEAELERRQTQTDQVQVPPPAFSCERGTPVGSWFSYERDIPVGSWFSYERGTPVGSWFSYERGSPVRSWFSYERGTPVGSWTESRSVLSSSPNFAGRGHSIFPSLLHIPLYSPLYGGVYREE